jgi:plastocyanin
MRERNMKRRGGTRAAAAVIAVGCVVAGVSAAAAAEPRAEVTVKAVPGTQWSPSAVTAKTGDTVAWDLNSGDGQPHNAAACRPAGCSGNEGPPTDPAWPSFKGAIATAGTETKYTFTQPGTYTFFCQVHDVMTGTITVTGSPVSPTATPSTTATPTATATPSATASPRPTVSATPTATPGITTPAPTGSALLDKTAPTLSKLKLKAVSRGATVSFTLSEPAAVTIRVKRGKSTVRTVRLSARSGRRSVSVRGSKLVRGSYKVQIEARDARGNKAAVQTKSLKVTR